MMFSKACHGVALAALLVGAANAANLVADDGSKAKKIMRRESNTTSTLIEDESSSKAKHSVSMTSTGEFVNKGEKVNVQPHDSKAAGIEIGSMAEINSAAKAATGISGLALTTDSECNSWGLSAYGRVPLVGDLDGDLNQDARGKDIYLCQSKGTSELITGLKLIRNGECQDSGMSTVAYSRDLNGDLNQGNSGTHILLCLQRGGGSPPVEDLKLSESSECPDGMERVPADPPLNGDLNQNAGGKFIYLCQKKVQAKPKLGDGVLCRGSSPSAPDSSFTRDGGGAGNKEWYKSRESLAACLTLCKGLTSWGCKYISWGAKTSGKWCYVHKDCTHEDSSSNYVAYEASAIEIGSMAEGKAAAKEQSP